MTTPGQDVAAIVVAGGSGERFGRAGGKQAAVVAGLPVLSWALRAMDEVDRIGLIVLVCHPDRVDEYRVAAVEPIGPRTRIVMVPGGESRQASAMAGLAAVPDLFRYIVVHDGARPLVTPQTIDRALDSLIFGEGDGVVVGHPCVDTLKCVDGVRVTGTPDRAAFWVAQTPQVFRAEALRHAYAAAVATRFIGTDDASVVERDGGRIEMLEGPRDNIKVTLPEDLKVVESALRLRMKDGIDA